MDKTAGSHGAEDQEEGDSGRDASPQPMSVLQRVLSKSRMRAFQDSDDEEGDRRNYPRYTPPPSERDFSKTKTRSPSPGGLVLKKDLTKKPKKKRKVKRPKACPSTIGEGLSEEGSGDDSASVISVCSSTDHSTSVKLRKKSRRHRCEVHGKVKRRSRSLSVDNQIGPEGVTTPASVITSLSNKPSEPGENDTPGDGPTTATTGDQKVCTCGKSSRSATRGKRPEPEGGYSTLPILSSHFVTEYEKIIYNNEPLFSDMEEDPVVDAQIRQESDRHHKRAVERCGSDNIFSAAQMLNTNTTIKFAIIQTELRNIIEVALRRVRKMECTQRI